MTIQNCETSLNEAKLRCSKHRWFTIGLRKGSTSEIGHGMGHLCGAVVREATSPESKVQRETVLQKVQLAQTENTMCVESWPSIPVLRGCDARPFAYR